MREFTEADKTRKKKRIEIPDNPADLSPDELAKLTGDVKAGMKDGYLSCPVAWNIARNDDVPRIAVGERMDKLGARIIDCQLGCFAVDKTFYSDDPSDTIPEELLQTMEELNSEKLLTCVKAFELAAQYKVKPMKLGNEATARNIKIRQCQLGCF